MEHCKKDIISRPALRVSPIAAALAGLLWCAGSAQAFNIQSDNPDVTMAWDQTVRYNAAWRMKGRDPGLANNLNQDESNYLFDKHQMINSRVDWFSEFDLSYKKMMGFRISGQAWYDDAYGRDSKALPGTTLAQQNIKGTFNNETKRYYAGPSAEFMDSFVWGKTNLGDTELVARLGRHAIIWGEGLFGNTQGVSYSQVPNDGRKGVASPGASAKETALPITQTTGTWQFLPNASLNWQYAFEWKPNRLSLGGTYVGTDAFSSYVSGSIARVEPEKGNKARGLMLKWNPELLAADVGLVYRKFSDTNPWSAQTNTVAGVTSGRYVYARDIELWGLTFNKLIGDFNVGAEISHRKNMALNTIAGNAGAGNRFEGPIGDTWHALLNGQLLFNKNAVWDNAVLVAELSYAGLDKVTRNAQFYKSNSNPAATACAGGADQVLSSCSTKNFWNLALQFQPTWLQVSPGLDSYLGLVYVVGLSGTAPTNGGGNKSSGQYKVTWGFDYQVRHKLELAYTAYIGRHEYGTPGSGNPPLTSGGLPVEYTVGGGIFSDRNWISATYTYNF
ncbi:MAG: DUF1302 family protein [Sterolibacterium sp.]